MSKGLPGPTASGSSRPDDPIMWLRCAILGDVTRVAVAGEVDLSNAHLLTELLESVATRTPLVAVDLSEVTFFGAYGTDALVRARRLLADRGGRLTLCRPAPVVRRVLDVTGTLAGFEVVDAPAPPNGHGRSARPVTIVRAGS
ncbi:STAS domain-containing protein [Micromonospora sp. NBS 11-29]|uniref:STAS domain-containing protein n=1 Tax=Micromonospora sp. NBS 11-29 TaxID=1960879 RepID=UPI000B775F38|nr:STAS domain-containing protein [Micromonospora sp. NBS 11-29]